MLCSTNMLTVFYNQLMCILAINSQIQSFYGVTDNTITVFDTFWVYLFAL